jgi:hypothetical protein
MAAVDASMTAVETGRSALERNLRSEPRRRVKCGSIPVFSRFFALSDPLKPLWNKA